MRKRLPILLGLFTAYASKMNLSSFSYWKRFFTIVYALIWLLSSPQYEEINQKRSTIKLAAFSEFNPSKVIAYNEYMCMCVFVYSLKVVAGTTFWAVQIFANISDLLAFWDLVKDVHTPANSETYKRLGEIELPSDVLAFWNVNLYAK